MGWWEHHLSASEPNAEPLPQNAAAAPETAAPGRTGFAALPHPSQSSSAYSFLSQNRSNLGGPAQRGTACSPVCRVLGDNTSGVPDLRRLLAIPVARNRGHRQASWYDEVQLLAHIPLWRRRDGCRLVFVCNDKTPSSRCQSSTDRVACRLFLFSKPSLSRPWRPAGVRSHGPPGPPPKPVLDRPKSEFAASVSVAHALCGTSPRYHGAMDQTGGLLFAQARGTILAVQLHSIRVAVPGIIEVYSVGSIPATKYRGAPDREPSPPGPWALVHFPQERRPDVKVENLPTMR